ncbi:MAG: succinate CoA transferase [Fibromonadaceae bacterium]|jgi:acetyl-CoA hydrolase/succinyl-CoA:acetate CoA-transferase|nr:succinate CoA transferase [Fibromonadaceae bacterium]
MHPDLKDKVKTAQEAAALINNGEIIGVSGFTGAGYPKVVPAELAKRAEALKAQGQEFSISLYTGASIGDECDGVLARAGIMKMRLPYQSHADVRNNINKGLTEYIDMHLSHSARMIRMGFVPKPTLAIVDACDVTPDGKIYLTGCGGNTPTYLQTAERIIIELNTHYGDTLIGLHDVFIPELRGEIHIHAAGDKIGKEYVQVDPNKIVAIVETKLPDSLKPFAAPDEESHAIAAYILEFLVHERKKGRLPSDVPYQSGVGNVANAVLGTMAKDPAQAPVALYTEVIQDSVFDILEADKLIIASGASVSYSLAGQEKYKSNAHSKNWKSKFVLRPQEISNNPEVIRRLGVISMNTALEADIFGHVNSTHVNGSRMMNGIGGSGDFARNCLLGFFMTPSVAKGGKISAIVPMVSHTDHTEHDTMVFVSEQGLADLRGLAPVKRARLIIEKCAHPNYRPLLQDYLEYGIKHSALHTPHSLDKAFDFHKRLIETGSMMVG